jgi:hypothetical protein
VLDLVEAGLQAWVLSPSEKDIEETTYRLLTTPTIIKAQCTLAPMWRCACLLACYGQLEACLLACVLSCACSLQSYRYRLVAN